MNPEKRKRGRPKIENPKNRNYRLRLTEEEYQKLEFLSSQYNETMAKFLRKSVQMRSEMLDTQKFEDGFAEEFEDWQ